VDLQAPVQDPNKPAAVDRWAEPVEPIPEASAEPGSAGEEPQGRPPAGKAADHDQDPDDPMGLESFRFNASYDTSEACPAGRAPVEQEIRDAHGPYRTVFTKEQREGCPLAARCPTRRLKSGDRVLRWRDSKAAMATRQRQQQESAFKEHYKIRSSIESSAADLEGRHGAKEMRVRGSPRVEMMAHLKSADLNTKRMVQYHIKRLAKAIEPDLTLAGAMR